MADELGEARAARAFLRASQVDSVMTVAGIAAGALVGGIAGSAAPVWLGGVGMIIVSLALAFVMPEMVSSHGPVKSAAVGTQWPGRFAMVFVFCAPGPCWPG